MSRFNQTVPQGAMQGTGAPGAAPQAPRSGLAIAGLVLGIIALLTSFLPIINNFSAVLAFIGAIFSVIGLVGALRGKKLGKGMAIAATVINVVVIAVVLGTQSMYSAAINEATNTVSMTSGSVAPAAAQSQAAGQGDQQGAAAAGEEPADKYTVADEQLVEDDYLSSITGTFTNTSGRELSYVQLSYNLFDADGAQIGTAYANTNNLADGGVWKFEAGTLKEPGEVASFKLADVTGF